MPAFPQVALPPERRFAYKHSGARAGCQSPAAAGPGDLGAGLALRYLRGDRPRARLRERFHRAAARGIPSSVAARLALVEKFVDRALSEGIALGDIYVDPLMLTAAQGGARHRFAGRGAVLPVAGGHPSAAAQGRAWPWPRTRYL